MPVNPPNIRIANNTKYILCVIRKKWLVLTPEEKVRQFILNRLINEQGYPQKYISVEKILKVNELSKRYDIVVFNRELQPKILIECKAEYIELKEKTLQQIATYNTKLQVPFLMVTNGNTSFHFHIKENTSTQINSFPVFEEL
ncbi:MAG: type I restriction enzyme HsdR N-terminal domain-containing protein [Chitinophagales bacterium]